MAEDNDTILFVNANMDADPGTDGLLANLEPTIEDNTPIKESIVKIEDTSNDGYKQDSNKFRCKECPSYTTDCEDKMKRHIRKVHRGLNPYQCGMCEYSTSNSVLYQEHVWIHEGVKPYKCTHCEYTCVSKKNLKKHETIHDPDYPLRCKVCGHIARHNRALRCHMKEVHSDVEKNSKNFKCQYCGVQFSTELQHSNHRKARRRCDVCKKVLCRSEFAKHMLEHGVTKVEPPPKVKRYVFSCKLCKWSGSNTPKILLHLIHHPDQDLSTSLIQSQANSDPKSHIDLDGVIKKLIKSDKFNKLVEIIAEKTAKKVIHSKTNKYYHKNDNIHIENDNKRTEVDNVSTDNNEWYSYEESHINKVQRSTYDKGMKPKSNGGVIKDLKNNLELNFKYLLKQINGTKLYENDKSKIIKKVNINNNVKNEEEDKKSIEMSEAFEENRAIQGSTRSSTRMEGNKMFKYNSSPDYEEYHEELKKFKF